jgi:hypothetical protein
MPGLHLMMNGCKLELHSDFHNGAWGYVYSLTRWEGRQFCGGETLLLRDGVPSYKKHHVDGEILYELIAAHFNQLLVFDDRIVHGTPIIQGSMDPLEARIALVGHIRATSPLVTGSIQVTKSRRVILEVLPQLRDKIRNYKDVQGTMTYRLTVAASGAVEAITALTENLVTPFSGYDHSDAVASVKSLIHQSLTGLRFPPAAGTSTLIVPVLIPLPDLRPIEFVVPFDLSRHTIEKWATTLPMGDEYANRVIMGMTFTNSRFLATGGLTRARSVRIITRPPGSSRGGKSAAEPCAQELVFEGAVRCFASFEGLPRYNRGS